MGLDSSGRPNTPNLPARIENLEKRVLLSAVIGEEEIIEEPQIDYAIFGRVYLDANANGAFDDGIDTPLPGVQISIELGQSGFAYDLLTDADGYYWALVGAGTYRIRQTQPAGYLDGPEVAPPGAVANPGGQNDTYELAFPGAAMGSYDFAERPADAGIVDGDLASLQFWQSPRGQRLLLGLNGGSKSKVLGNWLAGNFPNLYGKKAGNMKLENRDNQYIADLVRKIADKKGDLAEAQALAVALSVYVTTAPLAGNAAGEYGLSVTETGSGTKMVDPGAAAGALGLSGGSMVPLADVLAATDSMAKRGQIDAKGKARQLSSVAGLYERLDAMGIT